MAALCHALSIPVTVEPLEDSSVRDTVQIQWWHIVIAESGGSVSRRKASYLQKIKWIIFMSLEGDKSFLSKSRFNFGQQSCEITATTAF